MVERDPLAVLQAENARLLALLEANGIRWRVPPEPVPATSKPESSRFSTDEKVALFRRLFRGRTDVYPIRWESKTTAKSGYSPACANEWRAGVCEKPRIKCGDCGNRLLIPLSDSVIYDHPADELTAGDAICMMSATVTKRLTSPLLVRCVWIRKRPLRQCCAMTLEYSARPPRSARR